MTSFVIGDQYQLLLTYEHQLSKSAYSFLIGPFGGVKGRDFICILSLDGTLSFFEQETFSVSRNLPCFLLPSPFVYVQSSDSFVVHNANWTLECYRYITLLLLYLNTLFVTKLAESFTFHLCELF